MSYQNQNDKEVLKINRQANVYTNTEYVGTIINIGHGGNQCKRALIGKSKEPKMLKVTTQKEDLEVNDVYELI